MGTGSDGGFVIDGGGNVKAGSNPGNAGVQTSGAPAGLVDTFNLGDLSGQQVHLTYTTPNSNLVPLGGGKYGSKPGGFTDQSTDDFMAYFAGLSQSNPKQYAQIQQQLYQAGAYGGSKPSFGVYTTQDATAMKAVLTGYMGLKLTTPITLPDYIKQIQSAGIKNGVLNGAPRAPLTVQYTDPNTLKGTLQSAAQDYLGRNLSDKELNGFVSKFHGQEKTAQTAAYNNKPGETPPEASGDAQALLENVHTPEHQQKLAANYLDSINQMLGVL
jgi:hypothetical protein